jgi:fructose-1-phosphate kinase PfkB-like protein
MDREEIIDILHQFQAKINYDNAGLTISTRHLRRILHKMKSSRNELSFDNALHVLYTRVFIRKFPSIFEKTQNYVRPSAMHISNLALIKLMKVLKNNLSKNDIFVISGYGPFICIRPK